MEDCKVTSSETFVTVGALLQARVPALGARREQQGEVKRHGTLVLLGDNFEVPIPLGDHQVVECNTLFLLLLLLLILLVLLLLLLLILLLLLWMK